MLDFLPSDSYLVFNMIGALLLQMYDNSSAQIDSSAVVKLKYCVEYKQAQLAEMCSFRNKLNRMSDGAAEELHKVSYSGWI